VELPAPYNQTGGVDELLLVVAMILRLAVAAINGIR